MEFGDPELQAADHRLVECSASAAYDDQIAETLVEDELDRYPGVDAAEDRRERMLSFAHRDPPGDALVEVLFPCGDEPRITRQQPLDRLLAIGNRTSGRRAPFRPPVSSDR